MDIPLTSLVVVSITINVCVLSSIAVPAFFRVFLSRIMRGHYLVRFKETTQENPAFFRRV